MIKLKRIYDPASPADGFRILVDRIWPRGLTKQEAAIDDWQKDLAPSTALRKWFGHEPEKWPEFRRRYARELHAHSGSIEALAAGARRQTVTLVYAARDEQHNNAVVIRELAEAWQN